MKSTLTIKDLPVIDELDRKAMAAVHGGRLAQVWVDLIQYVADYTAGKCETSATGKSTVCY